MLKTLETTSNGASNASRSNTNPPSNPLRGQSFNNDSPDFSDYRAFHFKTTMPPQLRLDERSIVKPYTTIEAQTNALTSAVPGLLVGSVKTNPFENLPTEDKLGNVAQGFDGPSLTSEGKRQVCCPHPILHLIIPYNIILRRLLTYLIGTDCWRQISE